MRLALPVILRGWATISYTFFSFAILLSFLLVSTEAGINPPLPDVASLLRALCVPYAALSGGYLDLGLVND